MDWGKCELKDGFYKIPDNWLSIHYYEALTILFRLENSLRVFVYCILKDNHLGKWDQQTIKLDSESKTLAQIFSYRKSQSDDFGYLGAPCNSPLMFLSFGELTNIITGNNWGCFKEYFPAKKEIVKTKLDEINAIRNTLAHFRPISEDDAAIIKVYAEQVFKHVSEYLKNLVTIWQSFPTNSEHDWYKDLHNKSTNHINVKLTQSSDTSWVKIQIIFETGKVDTQKGKSFSGFFFNLDAFKIISDENIKRNLIYMTEEKPTRMYWFKDESRLINKTVNLVFSRKNLCTNYNQGLKETIETLIETISNEAEMVSSDKLHKGRLVSGQNLHFWERENCWNTDSSAFDSSLEIQNEPEYWGGIPPFSEYISSVCRYPWMSSDISKEDFPF